MALWLSMALWMHVSIVALIQFAAQLLLPVRFYSSRCVLLAKRWVPATPDKLDGRLCAREADKKRGHTKSARKITCRTG